MDYTSLGTNRASRLCGEAKEGQILISRLAIAVEDTRGNRRLVVEGTEPGRRRLQRDVAMA
jgi:class 3 adenylate cyclase